MKTVLTLSLLLATLWLTGCNQSAKKENKPDAVSSNVENKEHADMPTYDPAMDLTVTGGDAVEVLGDTLGIKMYIGTMQPGDSLPGIFTPTIPSM